MIELPPPSPTQHKMSLLRPSLTGRLLRAGAPRLPTITCVRYDSQTSSGIPLNPSDKPQPAYQTGESSMVNHPEANESVPRHNQPDYKAEVDQASS